MTIWNMCAVVTAAAAAVAVAVAAASLLVIVTNERPSAFSGGVSDPGTNRRIWRLEQP
jgi:hypothetical protein